MNEFRTLLYLELRSLWGINRFIHCRDPKEKIRFRLMAGCILLLICLMIAYMAGYIYGLCYLGVRDAVPAYIVVSATVLVIAVGIFTAGNRIFHLHGYDILASMPVMPRSIVISRLAAMYLENLLLTAMIALPAMVVYGLYCRPWFGFYFIGFVGLLFLPAMPTVTAVLFGAAVLAVSSRMRHKSLVQSGLMVLFVVGILLSSFSAGGLEDSFDMEAIAQLAWNVGALIENAYPPSAWLGKAMLGVNPLGLVRFVLVSTGFLWIAVWVLSRNFEGILHRLGSIHADHNYEIGTMEHRTLLKALWLREAKRFFSSSIYVTNTIVGPILGLFMAVSVAFAGIENIEQSLMLPIDLSGFLPFIFSGVSCTMTTTACSISMEGRQFWAIKSLPIPAKVWLDSKIALNLCLMAPFYVLSIAVFSISLRPDLLDLIWLIFIPGACILFCVVLGITLNLKFHSFDWDKEELPVKQSLSSGLGVFAGFLLAGIFGTLVFLVPSRFVNLAKLLGCLLICLGTVLLYRRNNETELTDL